ncbi:MAG: hypothetical protein DMF62_15210 [Acidobacteria bacterium]|nr:MAG: hypothetical protein DMF62_15210 [Acidobacteriota bacterium]
MKLTRSLLALSFGFALILPTIFVPFGPSVHAQTQDAALQRGYRTGYSDGYMGGYRDMLDGQDKGYERHAEYGAADRAFNKEYGSLEDYRDGYRQGFRAGYETGFDKKTFESVIPAGLTRKGVEPVLIPAVQNDSTSPADKPVASDAKTDEAQKITTPAVAPADKPATDASNDIQAAIPATTFRDDGTIMTIPKDTEIMIELQDEIGTQTTRAGERFTAKVISPMELDGAIVEGHVEKIQIPGRIKGAAEVQLSFDRLILSDTRWSNFNGVLTEVMPVKGDNVKRVSNEGTAFGQNSVKGDAI